MAEARTSAVLRQLDRYDLQLCLLLNRGCRRSAVERLFAAISRLGDGIIWYLVMLVLPLLDGQRGLLAVAHLAAVALCGVVIYKALKSNVVRQRPYASHANIRLGAAPLDRYSFPSGHTLHAVAFTIVLSAYYPQSLWVAAPFAAMVALSRMVLGLHYPSDVIAGAFIGALLALMSLAS